MKVGFIGLGVMGRPMALHVQRAGHALHVWARRPESVAGLPATIYATPAELGRQCEVVFTVITSSADVEAVALGADGLSEGMAPGSVLVDCSTIAPDVARHIAAQLGEKGIAMLDAPVSGGAQGAIDATLAIMAGGEADVLARVRPLLQCLGQRRQVHPEPARPQPLEQIAQHLHVHGAHGLDLGRAGLELLLLDLDAATHGLDHRGVAHQEAVGLAGAARPAPLLRRLAPLLFGPAEGGALCLPERTRRTRDSRRQGGATP